MVRSRPEEAQEQQVCLPSKFGEQCTHEPGKVASGEPVDRLSRRGIETVLIVVAYQSQSSGPCRLPETVDDPCGSALSLQGNHYSNIAA